MDFEVANTGLMHRSGQRGLGIGVIRPTSCKKGRRAYHTIMVKGETRNDGSSDFFPKVWRTSFEMVGL